MIPARVHIGTHRYVVDLSQMIRRPVASMRQAVDQGTEAGEQSLGNAGLWKRTCSDFILGQGQKFFDQEDEASRRRSRSVRGFDPLSNRRSLTQAYNMVIAASTANGGALSRNRMLKTNANIWVGTPGIVHRTASYTGWAYTTITGGPGASLFEDFTYFGGNVYVAYGTSGVYRGSSTGSTVASWSAVATKVLSAEMGRLVAGNGTALFELDSAGASIAIFTHPNTNWNWTAFTAGNAGIYAAGGDGLRSEIYLITVIDATGALAPPFPVAQLPSGEQIRSMAYFGGFLAITTTKGIRIAQAAQSGLLSYGPLIALGDTYDVAFEGRFAYATCTTLPDQTQFGVVALSLDRFTAPLTPAYAAVGWCNVAPGAIPTSIVTLGDRDFAMLTGVEGGALSYAFYTTDHLYSETAQYWSGAITYGTPEPKSVQSVEVVFDALLANQTVTVQLWDRQGGTMHASTTVANVGETSVVLAPNSEMLTETAEVFISTATSSGSTPVTVTRWTMRAVVAPSYAAEEIILPLMLAREVQNEDGSTVQLDPEAEWNYLTGLMRSRTKVAMQFGNETTDVWVDQVGVEQGWVRWDERGQWPEGVVLVRLVTIGATGG